jgi:branched-chain amino acid transport system permease protein
MVVVGLASPFIASYGLSEFGNTVLVQAAIAMIAIAGLHMLVQWTGQISLAHVALMGVSAFITARMNGLGVSLPVAMLLGVCGAVLVSFVIGLPSLRVRGLALAIITLAFSFAATRWLFLQPWLVPQSSGVLLRDESLFGFDIAQSRQLIIPLGLCLVAVLTATSVIGTSALGRSLRMVAHDEEVAASYGIGVATHKLFAFVYAGACAGLAGTFMVASIGQATISAFPVQDNILFLSLVLLAGPGALFGSAQVAASFAAFPVLASDLGRFVNIIGPVGMLLVVTLSPGGLNGMTESMNKALHRALTRRRRINRVQRNEARQQGGEA